jgi:hypothetical protein
LRWCLKAAWLTPTMVTKKIPNKPYSQHRLNSFPYPQENFVEKGCHRNRDCTSTWQPSILPIVTCTLLGFLFASSD